MKTTALLLMMLVPAVVSAQEKPTTGYAPVNGLKMYYEVHGSGDPVVLLHGAFMTITNNWTGWIAELAKTRKVIAVEMQGHGRTADIERDISQENLADDVAALLDHLKIPKADVIRLEHVAEMFRLKGGEVHGDLRPRSASRLAILPNTTHVTLMQRMAVIVPMVNDFLDAKP